LEGAIEVILRQKQNDEWRPVAFISYSLTETERNYQIYDKEMLASMLAPGEWYSILLGMTYSQII
jgi:hypothetical protein